MTDFASDFTYSAESGESTSAKLRRVEQERNFFKTATEAAHGKLTDELQERAALREVRDMVREQRDLAYAELASARQELQQRRVFMADLLSQPHWCIASDGGRTCQRCRAEITRGQAYELVALSLTQHVMCPEVTP